MSWKFFAGACILVGGALLPYAPAGDIAAGLTLAAILNWGMQRRAVARGKK